MQEERIYEKFVTSDIYKSYDTREEMANFTGQGSRGINISEFLPVYAAVNIPKGSIVKILPFEAADITSQGHDGFKAQLFGAATDIGASGVAMVDLLVGQYGFLQVKGYFKSVLFAVATTDGKPVWVNPTGAGVITAGTPPVKIIGMTTVGAFPIVSPATTVLATAFSANVLYVNQSYATSVTT